MTFGYFRRTPPSFPFARFDGTHQELYDELDSTFLSGAVMVIEDRLNPANALVIFYDQLAKVEPGKWIGLVENQLQVQDNGNMQGTEGTEYDPYTPPTPEPE